jgi:DNA-binding SARP family transcriptional activator/tetratricopeptide (TPR) repeat protein
VEFGVLGPVEVRDRGRPLAIGGERERLILAVLLLNANRMTGAGQLVDALWENPPPTAKAQLHNLISSLRRRLRAGGHDPIVTRPAGYELNLDGHDLDLVRFRELAARGRQAAVGGDHALARSRYTEALRLWRGPALADAGSGVAEQVRRALHEERIGAAEAGLDAALALGLYPEVLSEVAALIADDPYRERLHEIRMLALVGAGRRVDALDAYRELYRRFVDDLGVEPGPALRELEASILRGEDRPPVSTPRPPVPRQLPAATALLIGRDKLIGEACAELSHRAASHATTLLLVGAGGVGKSTLALAVGHHCAPKFPDGQLHADLRGSQDVPADPHHVLGRFLRAFGVVGAALPEDGDERIALYRSHIAGKRLLLVLDDAAEEGQVRPLLPTTPGSAAMITSRRQLRGLIDVARWTVPVMTAEHAMRLFASVVGAERAGRAPEATAEIVDLCGHLPLAVSVAAARLASRPEWTLEEFRVRLAEERTRLDELSVGDLDVRASIALSYRSLDPGLRALLRHLGMITTPDWPAWVAQHVTGRPGPVDRELDLLVDAHLVEGLGRDGIGQARFRMHDLVAAFARERAADEDGPGPRTAALERVLTGWLGLAALADARLDHGMPNATELSEPAGLAPPQVPGVAEAPTAWFEIERANLVAAVDQACRSGFTAIAVELALRQAGFLAMRSYDDDREQILAQALRAAREHGADALLVRLLGALFAVRAQRDQYAELPAIAEEQLAVARRLGDRRAEFQALTDAGRAARALGRFAAAADRLDQAIAVAQEAGLPDGLLSRALHSRAVVHTDLAQPELAGPLLAEAVARSRSAGNARTTAIQLRSQAVQLMETGRLEDAGRALDEALEITTTLDDARGRAWVEHAYADLDIRTVQWARAGSRLARSLRAHEDVQDAEGVARVHRSQADLALASGDPAGAVEPLERSLAGWRQLGASLEQARTLARLERVRTALGEPGAAAAAREAYREILRDLGLDEYCLRLPPC